MDGFEVLWVVLRMLFALYVGWCLLWAVAVLIGGAGRRDKAADFESENTTRRMARNAELIDLLYRIGKPDLPSGHYSEEKMALWTIYFEKESIHNQLTKAEHLAEIEGRYTPLSPTPLSASTQTSPQMVSQRSLNNLGGAEVSDVQ